MNDMDERLLGYKTCFDTKPVLYQDRLCSLTNGIYHAITKNKKAV